MKEQAHALVWSTCRLMELDGFHYHHRGTVLSAMDFFQQRRTTLTVAKAASLEGRRPREAAS
jgi:hypothetical protein